MRSRPLAHARAGRRPGGLAALAVIACALAACSAGPPEPVSPQALAAIQSDPGFTWTPQPGPLELGVTHTQDSLDPHHPDEATQRGKDILRADGAIWENHHLMGFGSDNPEPERGEYNWDSLDRRMELTERNGHDTILTLCCAPDWMKGGAEGHTDWATLTDAPLREHYWDFADLAAEAVKRYPQVERVMVWNEMKGFYDDRADRWNYEAYTEFYNTVYRAVKEARPDVKVGGPYVVLNSQDPGEPHGSQVRGPWGVADQRAFDAIEYWIEHRVGADFLAVDAATATRSKTIPTAVVGAQKFADLTSWLRARTRLPIWWAEFYPDMPGDYAGAATPASAATTLAVVAAFAETGAEGALLWGPQGSGLRYAALWTDSTQPDGGRPTPLTAAWQWLVPRLEDGEVEIGRSASSPLIVFRAPDGAVVVNPGEPAVEVSADTDRVTGWAVTVFTEPTAPAPPRR